MTPLLLPCHTHISLSAENRKLIRKEILESVTGTLKSVGDLDDDELLGAALGCAYSLAFKHEQRKVALFKAGAADTVLSIMHSHVGKPAVLKVSHQLLCVTGTCLPHLTNHNTHTHTHL